MRKIQIDYDVFITLATFYVANAPKDNNTYDYYSNYIIDKINAIDRRDKYKENIINKC